MAIQAIRVAIKNDSKKAKIYRFEGITKKEAEKLQLETLSDPVTQISEINPLMKNTKEVGYKPGVTDPIERSLFKAANLMGIHPTATSSSVQYFSKHPTPSQIEILIEKNPKTLIHQTSPVETEIIKIRILNNKKLKDLSQKRSLFLKLDEMKVLQNYYKNLGRDPTDLELEVFAQTWSEHCSHKTFKAILIDEKKIEYEPLIIRIKKASKKYFKKVGVVSAFSDNAGGMNFYEDMVIIGKGETHNSPVAIDPYAGSLTKNGGVYRDIAGFGKGGENVTSFMINNFAEPETSKNSIPNGVLEPKYLLLNNSKGEREYGNPMGIPTHAVSLHFHPNFAPKPTSLGVVIGITNKKHVQKDTLKKGDLIITIGGKTGRDGIHGATFSSGEMTESTKDIHSTAVQLGDPIMEKAAFDATNEARKQGLIKSITDCGAGGYASAIGEMANGVGAEVYLDLVPLKYKGLSPWEIFLSESQERMIIAVDPMDLSKFKKIAKRYDSSMDVIGKFTGDNFLIIKYKNRVCGEINLKFLHSGLPQRKMQMKKVTFKENGDEKNNIESLLSNLNICSKEEMHRMYDQTVQARTVMSPYVGVNQDIPSEASVIAPIPDKPYGIVSTYALNPIFNLTNPYKGSLWVFALAAAKFTSAGGDIDKACGIDNFIWPFPDEESLYGLHKSTEALVEMINGLEIPMVSGKDSLSSTYRGAGGHTIKAPPTLNITIFGRIPDISKTITPDIKSTSSILCLVGEPEMTSVKKLAKNLRVVRDAIQTGKVKSAKAVGEEGVVGAIALMCIGGDCGAVLKIPKILAFKKSAGAILVEVKDIKTAKELFKSVDYIVLGNITSEKRLIIKDVVNEEIIVLRATWQKPMIEILDERPRVAILTARGINRDFATKSAFESAGAVADIIHITQFSSKKNILEKYNILSIPGGFSYGDHVQSGRILALELLNPVISNNIYKHLKKGGLIVGVCNGFQALIQCGLLPFGKFHPLNKNKATLTFNSPNRFQSRWIYLKSVKSACQFVNQDTILNIPLASGEGRFLTIDDKTLNRIQKNNQIVFQYCDKDGEMISDFPINPNGSVINIAGICDPSGQILGMMPHAEDFIRQEHHPNWRRMDENMSVDGLKFFKSIVNAASQL